MKKGITVLARLVLAWAAIAGTAHAAPVVYDYTGGAIDITGITFDGVSILPSGETPTIGYLSSSTATFDGTGLTLAFALTQSATPTDIALSGIVPVGKSNSVNFNGALVTLSGLTADSIGSLSLSNGGGGNYSFNTLGSNGVAFAGTWGVTGVVLNGVAQPGTGATFGPNYKPISGGIGITGNGEMLQMNAVPLGNFMIDGQTLSLTGNIIFEGATPVPLPAAAWLLVSGLGLLGLRGRRRSLAVSS